MARPPALASRRRVRLSVDDRRRLLLELGMRAFGERSYDEVSIDDIAAQAGMSRSLLFHYFPSKHDYYVAVLRVAAEQLLAQTVGTADSPPAERLAAGLDAYFRFVEEHAASFATLLRAGVGTDAVVQALIEDIRHRYMDTIRRDLVHLLPAPASPARVRAGLRAWIGFVEALALDHIDHRDLYRVELVELSILALGGVFSAGNFGFPKRRPPRTHATIASSRGAVMEEDGGGQRGSRSHPTARRRDR